MWQKDRHQRIRALLSTLQRVSTERIMADLDVSRETVRRDLLDLEALGELRRVHGGAVRPGDEAPIAERAHTHVKSKNAIAKAATGVIASGQTLFIDAGTTTALLAEELAKLANLTIVTNSIDVALKLRGSAEPAEMSNEVILLGGSISERAFATTGATTILDIRRYRADVALLSPTGVDVRSGATNFDHAESEVARAMVDCADKIVILADYSKIGQRSRVSYCPAERIDVLITNSKATDVPDFAPLKKKVRKVIIA
ncbi:MULTISPECIES: DeoR/GlpR family DNA-binding transcription regulator [Paraburkholderia]|uniref:Transcriptional regulator, DeoR family n=1 Tax=Paraburkholderia megapolitana TaxID=420953 RepID=A0A1I3FXB5_9BURK|nr:MULTISPECIES: DeoR/GlpR family DNA-binding transcription regulator [Paraburkholderia]MCX4163999.1 DeoR/GlpR family DNA-binding transcription regulator [Paraburkholderia megapolitana]MDN7159494.1 DeoR/GlpR family DNA-binding transcription regulator [Paraburkholderia sp. CHISQ3]MDQ6496541.1 DeoR/GlpR family DNA-binding transcription regulator [Paraburkholderia megapolitana]QDQ82598.1 DeoR/GlpR transcriptional regulator [Paraburkholderia megapolitana]SFI15866.1 transcriptional regulator, DeoR 